MAIIKPVILEGGQLKTAGVGDQVPQSFVEGLDTSLEAKVDKVAGKGLSDTNYTQAEKTKLGGVATGATKNRSDSENADKVHNHTTEQVTGLDSALAGKVSNTDSRLTDSREWSATTVSQAEAEAGTATARKAWTAERVRQAASTTISAQKGIANGIASLDANAKIPLSQLSDSIIGQVEYMGLWAASTNTPTLPATPIQKGHYYVVSASGTQFGHSFSVGDWIISNGASWDKVDNTDAVSSINGRTGHVSGLAESNDARFTDSREWSAATITQAEAEAGTATTRRAFTAQSVRQAIVAWWNGITGTFGRDLVTSVDNTVARSKLGLSTSATRWPTFAEVTDKPTTYNPSAHTHPASQVTGLGTAATRDVGTASGDVMEVGAFGLGSGTTSTTYPSVPTTGTQVVHYFNAGVPGPLGGGYSDRTSYLEMNCVNHRTTIASDGSSLYFSWVYNKAPAPGDFKKLLTATDLPVQATRWPTYDEVTDKPLTDAEITKLKALLATVTVSGSAVTFSDTVNAKDVYIRG